MGFQFPPNSVSSAGFTRGEAIITPEQLKQRYFFGVDMTDRHGKEIPGEVLQHQINAAVSYIEHKLDIIIFPTKIVDNHDMRQVDYQEFNFLQLKKRPIMEVTELKAKFPNNRVLVDFPKEWFVVEKEAAQLQLAPVDLKVLPLPSGEWQLIRVSDEMQSRIALLRSTRPTAVLPTPNDLRLAWLEAGTVVSAFADGVVIVPKGRLHNISRNVIILSYVAKSPVKEPYQTTVNVKIYKPNT